MTFTALQYWKRPQRVTFFNNNIMVSVTKLVETIKIPLNIRWVKTDSMPFALDISKNPTEIGTLLHNSCENYFKNVTARTPIETLIHENLAILKSKFPKNSRYTSELRLHIDDPIPLDGVIDLVVGGKVIAIVDFKFGNQSEKYKNQLIIYAYMLSKCLNINRVIHLYLFNPVGQEMTYGKLNGSWKRIVRNAIRKYSE